MYSYQASPPLTHPPTPPFSGNYASQRFAPPAHQHRNQLIPLQPITLSCQIILALQPMFNAPNDSQPTHSQLPSKSCALAVPMQTCACTHTQTQTWISARVAVNIAKKVSSSPLNLAASNPSYASSYYTIRHTPCLTPYVSKVRVF
jgi:hypothetical protein